jgi:Zn-dependent protease/CBS domain-containing protein
VNGGVPIARLFGIEIRVSLSLALLVAVVVLIGADQAGVMAPGLEAPLQWLTGAIVALGFLASVVAHELAHALVGRRRGVATTSVIVGFMGSLVPISIQAARPRDELVIALAGPALSLVLAAVMLPVSLVLGDVGSPAGPVAGGLFVVGALNLALGVLSLLPGMPLDGGRAVRAIAWARTGDRDRASRASARAGRLTGVAIIGFGVVPVLIAALSSGILLVALGWPLSSASTTLDQRLDIDRYLAGATVAEALVRDVPRVGPALTVDTFAARLLDPEGPRAVPVMDGERVLGVIGAGRIRRLSRAKLATQRASDVMVVPPAAPLLTLDHSLWDAVEIVNRRSLDGLAVVSEAGLEGMITRESLGSAVRARVPEWVVARRRWRAR